MITANHKLADIISRNINILPIVFRFGIGSNIGNCTIEKICFERNIDLNFFLSVVNTYDSGDYFPKINCVDLRLLIDFLTKTHEYHKSFTIPKLKGLMVELKHRYPNLKLSVTLEKYLNDYIDKLLAHIEFEEKNIFPLIIAPGKQDKASLSNLKKIFGQHTNVETELSDLIMIIIQHIPQNSDVQLFHEILHSLSHFEKEQIDHARFEDKILVPRLMELVGGSK